MRAGVRPLPSDGARLAGTGAVRGADVRRRRRAGQGALTIGPNRDPAELGPQPANVRVERYVPQSLLLPRCDAMVAHGGSGTKLAALALGLPLLLLPQGANQFWNADRCAALGVGIRLLPDEVGPAPVRQAVRALLDQPGYRARAGVLAAEIGAMPGPEEAVPLLEALAGQNG